MNTRTLKNLIYVSLLTLTLAGCASRPNYPEVDYSEAPHTERPVEK